MLLHAHEVALGLKKVVDPWFKLSYNLNRDLIYLAYKEKFCALKCRITKKCAIKQGWPTHGYRAACAYSSMVLCDSFLHGLYLF